MKKIFILALTIIALTSCDGKRKFTDTELKQHSGRIVYYDDLRKWCDSDTVRHKVFCFFRPGCPGCQHEFENYLKPILENIDTAKCVFYFIDIENRFSDYLSINENDALMSQMGIPMDRTFYWAGTLDPLTYGKIIKVFKTTHKPSINAAVPKTFVVDKNGYVALIKTYLSPELEEYEYRLNYCDDSILAIDDYSKESDDYIYTNSK
ncbi:MAG: hypothetical protein MJZ52_04500 [Bacteroidales bacterium]|nr:hypothetical protein [Bacteroidales bacterium]